MESKFCTHCQVEHPLTSEFFRKNGKYWRCKKRDYDFNKKYVKENPDWHREQKKKYYQKNKDKVKAKTWEYTKKRISEDPAYKLAINLRGRMYRAIRGGYKTGSAVKDLGCSVDKLRLHLEAQFQEGMSWDNYGKHGWHIDHIRPLSSFDLSDKEQFELAVHYTNLQPLWAKDNLTKHSKYNKE